MSQPNDTAPRNGIADVGRAWFFGFKENEMFGFITSAVKAASAVIDIPLAIVADTITIGGVLNDKDTTYTGDAAARLVKNVKNMADPK